MENFIPTLPMAPQGYPLRELAKRNRKWDQPVTPPTDPRTLPPSVPIVDNPNGLGIA